MAGARPSLATRFGDAAHKQSSSRHLDDEDEENAQLIRELHEACTLGKATHVVKVVNALIEAETDELQNDHVHGVVRLFLSTPDDDGWTALHFAAQGGTDDHTEIIKKLCEGKADVNVADHKRGWSPLHVAAQFAQDKALEVLVDALADRELKDCNEMTPRDCANGKARRNKLEMPKKMLDIQTKEVHTCLKKVGPMMVCEHAILVEMEDCIHEVDKQLARALGDASRMEDKIGEIMSEDNPDLTISERLSQVKELMKYRTDAQDLRSCIGQVNRELKVLKERSANSHLLEVIVEVRQQLHIFADRAKKGDDPANLRKEKSPVWHAKLVELETAVSKGKRGEEDELVEEAGSWATPELFRTALEVKDILEELTTGEPDLKYSLELEKELSKNCEHVKNIKEAPVASSSKLAACGTSDKCHVQ